MLEVQGHTERRQADFAKSPRTSEAVTNTCFHCSERCDHNTLPFQGKYFCCAGCQTVYELLQNNDLCGYYDFEQRGTPSFKQTQHSRFTYLDDDDLRPQLLQFSDGIIAKITLRLPQIHCASCIWLLENLFKINPAISRSEVNFLTKEIALTFREQEIKLSEVVSLLTKLGYEPDIRLDANATQNQASTNSQHKLYLQVGLAGFAFGNVMLFSLPDYLDSTEILSANFKFYFGWLSIVLATPVLLFSASDYFISSWYALRQRKISLDVPVALGISALYFRSIYDIISGAGTGYLDSFTGLVFFLLIGKIFQQKTFAALSFDRDYAAYFPLSVALLKDEKEIYIPVAKLKKGDIFFSRNRELVPADSVLQSAQACIDYSFVTGEASPVTIHDGDLVYAGGRVVGTGARFTVIKEVSHSYLTQLWNNEVFHKEKRSSLLDVSDAFGKYFTMTVSAIAIIAAWYWLPNVDKAINVFTAVLIIACPCALTLAAPFTLGTTVAIFGKAKFYLKNVGVVTDLAALNAIVFDKTGTLTHAGDAKVEFIGEPLSDDETEMIIECLQHSTHPLSRQILGAQVPHLRHGERSNAVHLTQEPVVLASNFSREQTSDVSLADRRRDANATFQEIVHCGIEGNINRHRVAIGSAAWITVQTNTKTQNNSSSVYIAIDNIYRGYFRVDNSYRVGIDTLLKNLRPAYELFLLSGDNDSEQANLLSLFPEYHLAFYQTPEDKLQFVKSLQQNKKIVAMIGDGLNDAGALQQSNVGIALTEDTSAFTPACDAILAAENLNRLPVYIDFARYALRVLVACFSLSLVYNVVGLSFAITGKLSPLVTAILMPISSLSVVAIAWGAMKIRQRKITQQ